MRHDIYTLPEIMLVGGQTETIRWQLFDLEGQPFDASDLDVRFALVNYSSQSADTPDLTVDATIEEGDTAGTDNVVQVVIGSDATASMYGKYIYQLTMKDGAGNVQIPGQGIIFITHNIDQSFIS